MSVDLFKIPMMAFCQLFVHDLGLRGSDLLDVFGDRGTASKVLNGQRSLSLTMIRTLSERLSLPVSLLIQPSKPGKYSERRRKILEVQEPKSKYRKKKT